MDLDSQGTNDSSGVTDGKALTDALKQLHDRKVGKIKVIWMVESGDLIGRKQEFQTQVKFIKSLDSCLIIKKRGRPQPKHVQIKGLLAAANHYSDSISSDDA